MSRQTSDSTGQIAGAPSISSRIRAEVGEAVDRCADQFHMPPWLLLAVIKAESDFNATVISRTRASRH